MSSPDTPPAADRERPVLEFFQGTPTFPPIFPDCVGREEAWNSGAQQTLDGRHWRVPYPDATTASRRNPAREEHQTLNYCSAYIVTDEMRTRLNPQQIYDVQLNRFCCTSAFSEMEKEIRDAALRNSQLPMSVEARKCMADWRRGRLFADLCMDQPFNQACESVDFENILYPGCFSHGFASLYDRARQLQRQTAPTAAVHDGATTAPGDGDGIVDAPTGGGATAPGDFDLPSAGVIAPPAQ